jgi:hypothetical protein
MTLGRTVAGLGIAGTAAVVYGRLVRPRLLHWGATEEEIAGPYPGAELVPGGRRGATMAVTIDAPPDQVWPWLGSWAGIGRVGIHGTTWTTQGVRVPGTSTRSGSTSPSATP